MDWQNFSAAAITTIVIAIICGVILGTYPFSHIVRKVGVTLVILGILGTLAFVWYGAATGNLT